MPPALDGFNTPTGRSRRNTIDQSTLSKARLALAQSSLVLAERFGPLPAPRQVKLEEDNEDPLALGLGAPGTKSEDKAMLQDLHAQRSSTASLEVPASIHGRGRSATDASSIQSSTWDDYLIPEADGVQTPMTDVATGGGSVHDHGPPHAANMDMAPSASCGSGAGSGTDGGEEMIFGGTNATTGSEWLDVSLFDPIEEDVEEEEDADDGHEDEEADEEDGQEAISLDSNPGTHASHQPPGASFSFTSAGATGSHLAATLAAATAVAAAIEMSASASTVSKTSPSSSDRKVSGNDDGDEDVVGAAAGNTSGTPASKCTDAARNADAQNAA